MSKISLVQVERSSGQNKHETAKCLGAAVPVPVPRYADIMRNLDLLEKEIDDTLLARDEIEVLIRGKIRAKYLGSEQTMTMMHHDIRHYIIDMESKVSHGGAGKRTCQLLVEKKQKLVDKVHDIYQSCLLSGGDQDLLRLMAPVRVGLTKILDFINIDVNAFNPYSPESSLTGAGVRRTSKSTGRRPPEAGSYQKFSRHRR